MGLLLNSQPVNGGQKKDSTSFPGRFPFAFRGRNAESMYRPGSSERAT